MRMSRKTALVGITVGTAVFLGVHSGKLEIQPDAPTILTVNDGASWNILKPSVDQSASAASPTETAKAADNRSFVSAAIAAKLLTQLQKGSFSDGCPSSTQVLMDSKDVKSSLCLNMNPKPTASGELDFTPRAESLLVDVPGSLGKPEYLNECKTITAELGKAAQIMFESTGSVPKGQNVAIGIVLDLNKPNPCDYHDIALTNQAMEPKL